MPDLRAQQPQMPVRELLNRLANLGSMAFRNNIIDAGWAGEDYDDPDAVGANPTALRYPDGTIVGSTDNGDYIKYPNGTAKAWQHVALAITGNGNLSGTWTYPIVLSGDIVGRVIPRSNSASNNNITFRTSNAGTSSATVYITHSASSTTNLSGTVKGYW